ncbi:SCO2400 family protein [Streptomyces sparsogenes]|uniref:SCO2400 family protein n=1 Tax=Streptomyces sparsogenes TaxID=67365 RepID=UPI00340825E9
MDYCPSCRRHLNGAVSCPGCGAYAGGYAYPATEGAPLDVEPDDEPSPAPEAASTRAEAPEAGSTRADRRKAARGKPRPRGIIGGRARRARRGRRRRVTIMAAVLGPVLAGLFVAEIATEGGIFHEPSSSSGPDASQVDRGPGAGDSGGPSVRESGAPGAGPSAGADGASADEDKDAVGKDGEKSKDGKKSRDGEKSGDGESPGPDDPSSAGVSGGPSATPTATGGGGGGSTQDPTSPSDPGPTTVAPTTPAPTPTEGCDRFLWWCT